MTRNRQHPFNALWSELNQARAFGLRMYMFSSRASMRTSRRFVQRSRIAWTVWWALKGRLKVGMGICGSRKLQGRCRYRSRPQRDQRGDSSSRCRRWDRASAIAGRCALDDASHHSAKGEQ